MAVSFSSGGSLLGTVVVGVAEQVRVTLECNNSLLVELLIVGLVGTSEENIQQP